MANVALGGGARAAPGDEVGIVLARDDADAVKVGDGEAGEESFVDVVEAPCGTVEGKDPTGERDETDAGIDSFDWSIWSRSLVSLVSPSASSGWSETT